jgi:hypothetical protein
MKKAKDIPFDEWLKINSDEKAVREEAIKKCFGRPLKDDQIDKLNDLLRPN